jgi:hypothetical protein
LLKIQQGSVSYHGSSLATPLPYNVQIIIFRTAIQRKSDNELPFGVRLLKRIKNYEGTAPVQITAISGGERPSMTSHCAIQ